MANDTSGRRNRPEWTSRQKQVLDLLTAGKTNYDIALTLGLSLEGANWHVREIMHRLDLTSRDDVAEYWRHENGLQRRLRFSNWKIPSGLTLSTHISSVALVTFTLTMMLALSVSVLGDAHDSDPSLPSPFPAQETTQAILTVTPTSNALPFATVGTVQGVPARELSRGPNWHLTESSWVYYAERCTECRAGTLYRGHPTSTGSWYSEEIPITTESARTAIPFGDFITDGRGHFAVLSCLQATRCQQSSTTSDPARFEVLQTKDYGASWSRLAEVGENSQLIGFTADREVILREGESFRQLPSGAPIQSLTTATELPIPSLDDSIVVEHQYLSLTHGPRIANASSTYIATTPRGAPVQWYWAFTGGIFRPSLAISSTQLLGSAERSDKVTPIPPAMDAGQFPRGPVLVDLYAGTISEFDSFRPLTADDEIIPLAIVLR